MLNDIHKISMLNCQLFVGYKVFDELKTYFEVLNHKSNELFVLVDENTRKYCLPDLINKINTFDRAVIIEIKSGEENKTINTAVTVWKKLLEFGADRNAVLVNLGGGVICDMGGFIASLYKRGIKFINIPTTLMAQVDAGYGGKTGIDMDGLKNQIGLFNNPEAVFIYPGFINTLNRRQRFSGFAEVIKHTIINNLFSLHNIIDFDLENEQWLISIICHSVETKCRIIEKDFTEAGSRKILNFGHTIGHAIETHSLLYDKDPLLHGEAIAVGLICEIFLSTKKLGFPQEIQNKINSFIIAKFGKYEFDKSIYESLLGLMINDKKNLNRDIQFVLMKDIGIPLINQVCDQSEIIEALDYYHSL